MNNTRQQDENYAPVRNNRAPANTQSRRKTDDNIPNLYGQNASTSRGVQGGNRRGRQDFNARNKNNQYYWRGDGNTGSADQKKANDPEKEKQLAAQKRGPLPDWDEVADTGKDEMFDYMDMMEQQYAQYYAMAGIAPFDAYAMGPPLDPAGSQPRVPSSYGIGFRPPFMVPPPYYVPPAVRAFVPEEGQNGRTTGNPTEEHSNGSRPESADSSLTTSIPATPTPLMSPEALFHGALSLHPAMNPNFIMGPNYNSFNPPTDPAQLKDLVRRQM